MHMHLPSQAGKSCHATPSFNVPAGKYTCRKFRECKRQRLNSVATDDQQVLHTFWKARGVTDHQHREKLIEVALQDQPTEPAGEIDTVLPGAHAYWQLDTRSESRPQVQHLYDCNVWPQLKFQEKYERSLARGEPREIRWTHDNLKHWHPSSASALDDSHL